MQNVSKSIDNYNDFASEKYLTVPSILRSNTINYIQFLKPWTKVVLDFILSKMKLSGGGHVLTDVKTYCNSEIAFKLGISRETVRKCKEELHARNILLIDGKTWESYRVLNKQGFLSRFRTDQRQAVTLSPEFIAFFYKSAYAKKIGDTSAFEPHQDYVKKQKDIRRRNLISREGYLRKLVISMCNSCGVEPISLVPNSEEKVPMTMAHILRYEERIPTNEDSLPNGCYSHSVEKPSIKNALTHDRLVSDLLNRASVSNTVVKPFNESVKRFCDHLLQSGKTIHEVYKWMAREKYVVDLTDFKAKYQHHELE